MNPRSMEHIVALAFASSSACSARSRSLRPVRAPAVVELLSPERRNGRHRFVLGGERLLECAELRRLLGGYVGALARIGGEIEELEVVVSEVDEFVIALDERAPRWVVRVLTELEQDGFTRRRLRATELGDERPAFEVCGGRDACELEDRGGEIDRGAPLVDAARSETRAVHQERHVREHVPELEGVLVHAVLTERFAMIGG